MLETNAIEDMRSEEASGWSLSVLRQILKRAKLWYRFSDEYTTLRNRKPPVGRALTPEEQERLFGLARTRPTWLYAYVATTLSFYCGLRACEIKVLTSRVTTGLSIAYPSTLVFNPYGFVFDSCNFTAESGATGVALARQWVEAGDGGSATAGWAVGKMIVRNSTLGAHLAGASPWSSMGARTTTPKDPAGTTPVVLYTSDDYFPAGVGPAPAEPFLGEYRNSGAGAHQ